MSKDIINFSDKMNFVSSGKKLNIVINTPEENNSLEESNNNIDYDKGFSTGWSECESKMSNEIKTLQSQLNDITNTIPNNLKKYFDEIENQVKYEVADIAIKLSEIILKKELTLKEHIQPLIDDILAPLTTLDNVKLYLNPGVVNNIKTNQEPSVPNNIQIISEPNLMYGEARLECDQGVIDATLTERLQTAKEAINEKLIS